MPNSRLLWPTSEELHQRYELMDQMMEAHGVDVLAALGVDGASPSSRRAPNAVVACMKGHAGIGWRVKDSEEVQISVLTPRSSGHA